MVSWTLTQACHSSGADALRDNAVSSGLRESGRPLNPLDLASRLARLGEVVGVLHSEPGIAAAAEAWFEVDW